MLRRIDTHKALSILLPPIRKTIEAVLYPMSNFNHFVLDVVRHALYHIDCLAGDLLFGSICFPDVIQNVSFYGDILHLHLRFLLNMLFNIFVVSLHFRVPVFSHSYIVGRSPLVQFFLR